jgi:hypothetical protein
MQNVNIKMQNDNAKLKIIHVINDFTFCIVILHFDFLIFN